MRRFFPFLWVRAGVVRGSREPYPSHTFPLLLSFPFPFLFRPRLRSRLIEPDDLVVGMLHRRERNSAQRGWRRWGLETGVGRSGICSRFGGSPFAVERYTSSSSSTTTLNTPHTWHQGLVSFLSPILLTRLLTFSDLGAGTIGEPHLSPPLCSFPLSVSASSRPHRFQLTHRRRNPHCIGADGAPLT